MRLVLDLMEGNKVMNKTCSECALLGEFDGRNYECKHIYKTGRTGSTLLTIQACEHFKERGKNMIQNIEVSKIHQNPNNPRKDLGDLSELAESIKISGILQNLTVVPWYSQITGLGCDDQKKQEDMGYIVIIGHRRLAAAKLAGLTEVPCSIADMDKKTQIATMLLENMQRSDLTVWEQAHGFQMMLDLGETFSNISEKTGFSERTVRRRMKLLELDKDKFKASAERGATLMDYAELEKIKDINLRNSVLDKIGTANFKYELQRAIDKEKSDANMALIVAELEKFATKVENSNGLQYVKSYYTSSDPIVTIPNDSDTVEYFFETQYGYVTLYNKRSQSEASLESDEKEKARRECRSALDEISKRAYQLRRDFIKEISNATAKKNIGIIIKYSVRTMLDTFFKLDYEEYAEFLGIEINKENEEDEWTFDDIAEHVTAHPERHLLVAIYLALDSENEHYYNWNNQHAENEELNTVYDFLQKLGYETSDDESSMRYGTHELLKVDSETKGA